MGPCIRIRGETLSIKSTQPSMPAQLAIIRKTKDSCTCVVIKTLPSIRLRAEKAISPPPSCPSIKDHFIMLLHRGVAPKFNQNAALTELEWTESIRCWRAFKSVPLLRSGRSSAQPPLSWDSCTRWHRTHKLMVHYVRCEPAAAGFHLSSEAFC